MRQAQLVVMCLLHRKPCYNGWAVHRCRTTALGVSRVPNLVIPIQRIKNYFIVTRTKLHLHKLLGNRQNVEPFCKWQLPVIGS